MPNISFDIFFDQDIINLTATRSGSGAPKVKPGWKVKTAPKLAAREGPRPTTISRPRITDVSEPTKAATKSKSAPKAEDATKAVNGEAKKATSKLPAKSTK